MKTEREEDQNFENYHNTRENEVEKDGDEPSVLLSANTTDVFVVDVKVKEVDTRGKKRKREKEQANEEEVEGGGQDPLLVFGSDIMMVILSHLDAGSVALSLLVSRGWHGVACSDRLWTTKCEELWLEKAHIPRMIQFRGLSKLAVYSLSVMDGKRNRILKDDLCDHVWEFHFNKAAPIYWRNLDPYWDGTGPPMRRYFHPDGSQSADPDDKVWGGHESCYSTVTSFVGDGKIRAHYVRINRWPGMSISRKQDWSWEMSNHLYCYSSIPDTDKQGGTGAQGQWRFTTNAGLGLGVLKRCARLEEVNYQCRSLLRSVEEVRKARGGSLPIQVLA